VSNICGQTVKSEAEYSFPDGTETFVDEDEAYGLVERAAQTWGDRPTIGFTGAGTTPREASVSVELDEKIVIPFNFGRTDEFHVFLLPGLLDLLPLGFSKTGSSIIFDATGWDDFVGTWDIGIWLQLGDLEDYFELTLEITEPDPGP